VLIERGKERERRLSRDPDNVLYWLIKDVTFPIGCDYELAYRVEGEDFRRVLFARQIELLARLDRRWAMRAMDELNAILVRNPFMDALRPRRLAAPAAGSVIRRRRKPARRVNAARAKKR